MFSLETKEGNLHRIRIFGWGTQQVRMKIFKILVQSRLQFFPSTVILIVSLSLFFSAMSSVDGKPGGRNSAKKLQCYQCRYIFDTIDPENCKHPNEDTTPVGVCDDDLICGKILMDKELHRKCVEPGEHCSRKRNARTYACDKDLCNSSRKLHNSTTSIFFPIVI